MAVLYHSNKKVNDTVPEGTEFAENFLKYGGGIEPIAGGMTGVLMSLEIIFKSLDTQSYSAILHTHHL